MIPDNITKEHVLQAIAEINKEGIRKGRHSTTYDLLHNGKAYPPKLVISIANRYANGIELEGNQFPAGMGHAAFKLLKREGFEIVPKNDPVKRLISQYKTKISSTRMKDEVYKWEMVNVNQGRPNIEASDFQKEVKEVKFKNTIYHLGPAVLNDMASENPEELRDQFKNLFNEGGDLSGRVKAFDQGTLNIYRKFVKKQSHHQDERSISNYLTFMNPSKYTFYKASFYGKYCKVLDVPQAKKNEKYAHYLELIEELIDNYISTDQALIDQVKDLIPEYYDGTNHLLLAQDILYQVLDQDVESNYWLYAPGTNADMWDEFHSTGIMGLGWDELGDLETYSSKAEIVLDLQAFENTTSSKKNDATANYEFVNNFAIGDIIIVKKGRGVLLGYGVVTSEYYHDTSRSKFQHCRKVEWKKRGVWKVDHSLALKTLTNVTAYASDDSNYEKYYEKLLALMEDDQLIYNYKDDFVAWLSSKYSKSSGTASSYLKSIDLLNDIVDFEIYETNDLNHLQTFYRELIKDQKDKDSKYFIESAQSYGTHGFFSASIRQYIDFLSEYMTTSSVTSDANTPLNLIIYGPPGTGKTYMLKNHFFERYTSSESIVTRDEYIQRECASLAWWEVIALAVMDIGKAKAAEIKKHEYVQHKVASSNSKTIMPTIWGQLQSHTIDECEFVNVAKKFQIQIFNKTIDSEWEIVPERLEEQTPELLSIKETFDNYQPEVVSKNRYRFVTFHQSYSYEDFIEGIKPRLDNEGDNPDTRSQISYEMRPGVFREIVDEALADSENDYAIFIDEINRGNIASIFGELITLIEVDKRKGMSNEISATLPYSGDDLSIPPNLHIIGTMNTADRSVEALDTALRRRFSFLEINPDPNLLNNDEYICEGIDLSKMLSTINRRIEKLLDKDYCIGHSYFMTIQNRGEPLADLIRIFSNNILPLLQEYFYGDWGKIRLVIGKSFVSREDNPVNFLTEGIDEDYEEYSEKPIYRFTDHAEWTLDSFTSIYE
jgi:Cdc6-like AAA superfamily ATPase